MRKINIAIDGHSSCGKSTIAKALAKKMNYIYVDSGAMYRALTLYAMQHHLIVDEQVMEEELLEELANIHIHFEKVDDLQHTFLNGVDVELEIRSPKVSEHVSQIAKIPKVREFLVKQQKELGSEKGLVMDGRDIGTVVFPGAEAKFFVTANVMVRAKRRYEEMKAKGYDHVSMDEIKANIEERDFVDSHREVSPLIQANDALMIDTSNLSPDEQLAMVYEQVQKVLKKG
jgi:cytidylate kinase